MVIHTTGQSKLTTEIALLFDLGQYGDDDTLESESDSGLISPIVATSKSLGGFVTGNNFQLSHELLSADANSQVLREFTVAVSGSSVTRVTTFPVTKTDQVEITTFNLWNLRYN